ncbi:MAG: DUF2851 family protein [Verrucomicrobiota bacterium]
MTAKLPSCELSEIPGEFGPITISERVVQRIWLRQDFARNQLRTTSGRAIQVIRPGQWNLQEGPDFRDAVLEIDGERVDGDVEIHFYPNDWFDHEHEADPNFGRVVLHVVVFEDQSRPAFTALGSRPETLVLLPYLNRDLESYASDDALLALERRDHVDLLEFYLSLSPEARYVELRDLSFRRWQQKRTYARQRLERLGWREACHQAMLEVLGYRRNRAPMNALAERFPIRDMAKSNPDELFDALAGQWKLSGLRPANHPRKRLHQYTQILQANHDWPEALKEWSHGWTEKADPDEPSGSTRRALAFTQRRNGLAETVFAGTVSGPRLDTLTVDAFLPLLSVDSDRDLFGTWHHWFIGDGPEVVLQFLREAGVTDRQQPRCNGLLQGALQRFFNQGL